MMPEDVREMTKEDSKRKQARSVEQQTLITSR
jgi:hypothetical protein